MVVSFIRAAGEGKSPSSALQARRERPTLLIILSSVGILPELVLQSPPMDTRATQESVPGRPHPAARVQRGLGIGTPNACFSTLRPWSSSSHALRRSVEMMMIDEDDDEG